MINPQWLELLMSRTIFYGPKDVRATEVRLYKQMFGPHRGALPQSEVHIITYSVKKQRKGFNGDLKPEQK